MNFKFCSTSGRPDNQEFSCFFSLDFLEAWTKHFDKRLLEFATCVAARESEYSNRLSGILGPLGSLQLDGS